jgi:hypothetical protein
MAQPLLAETLSAIERIEHQQNLEDVEEARRILAETKPEDWISWEQLKAEIGRSTRSVERRAMPCDSLLRRGAIFAKWPHR